MILPDEIENFQNRLENLQLISHRLNSSKDRKNGTSKYTGVFWDKQKKMSTFPTNKCLKSMEDDLS